MLFLCLPLNPNALPYNTDSCLKSGLPLDLKKDRRWLYRNKLGLVKQRRHQGVLLYNTMLYCLFLEQEG